MTTKPPSTTPTIVLPGDDVTNLILKSNPKKNKKSPKLGTGLHHDPTQNRITTTQSGQLHHQTSNNTYFIRNNKKRYVPKIGDNVIAIVEERVFGDYYRTNIFGPHPAILHQLAFEGATKRNKPNLIQGSLLYCRVIKTCRDTDPELSCQVGNETTNVGGGGGGGAARKDWMTDEGTYGELKGGGMNVRISIGLARELLQPNNVVLNELGKSIAFEIAIGVNGVIWVNAKEDKEVVLICNAIRNSEVMTCEQVRKMVKELLESVGTSY